MSDNILLEKMFDLPEFKITDLKHNENDIRIYVEKREKPIFCPQCGLIQPSLRVHNTRIQEVRDVNIMNKRVGLIFRRKRYKCMDCKSTFYELSHSIAPKSRLTNRLRDYIAHQSKTRSFTEIEEELDISKVTIRDIFLEEMQKLPKHMDIETPKFIGIDEIHIQREGKHRKQAWALICNGDKNTVIDLLPDRNKGTIVSFLSSLKEPEKVDVVTMDMWQPYRDAVYTALPFANIVIDKFHVVKMGNEALDKIRKSHKDKLGKKKNKALKQDRYVLLKREHDLKPMPDIMYRDAWFSEIPELETAYNLKEELFKIYDEPTKPQAINKYDKWKASIPSDMEEFIEVAKTIDNWHREIFNYFDFRVTNAFVEGINSTIRFIEKQGRGYGFDVLRAKIMYCINHKVAEPRKPKYSENVFYDIFSTNLNGYMFDEPKTKNYGVPLKSIMKELERGFL